MQDILATRQGGPSSAGEEAPSLVHAIWQKRWVMLICVLVAGAAGGFLSSLQSPQYTATSRIFLSATGDFDPLNTNQFNNDPQRFLSDQLAVIDSTSVLQSVITNLGLKVSPFTLHDELNLTGSTDSDVITVEATAKDPAQSAKIADAVGVAYQSFVANRVSTRQAAAVARTTNLVQIQQITTAAALYGDGVLALEKANVPTSPSSPQPVRDGLILALIAAFAAAAYALYTQSWSKRRVGPAEASAIFGAPILGDIPDRGRLAVGEEIATAHSEPGDAYRMAAVGLDYIRGTAPGVFLVTGPHSGAGSSVTALNLAAAAADHGRRVFVLNIEDNARPRPENEGDWYRVTLHDLAQGKIDLGHAVETRAGSRAHFGVIRVDVIQPVQGHPVGDVQRILDQLPDDTDLVLLDSPPLPGSSASFVLGGQVDAVIVVIDGSTTPADLEELQRRCRLAGVPVAGVVLNHIRRATRPGGRRTAPSGPRVLGDSQPAAPVLPQLPTRRPDDTAPRGLPILTGGTPIGDGRVHVPYAAGDRTAAGGPVWGPAVPWHGPPPPDGGQKAASTNGGATNGGANNAGATNDGATNGGATNGGATNGGATNGGATNGGATNGNGTGGASGNNGAGNNGAANGHGNGSFVSPPTAAIAMGPPRSAPGPELPWSEVTRVGPPAANGQPRKPGTSSGEDQGRSPVRPDGDEEH